MDKELNNSKLTAKQKRFVEEYMVDLNATQAAIRAGYSKKTAHDIGCENLMKPNIKSEIEILQNKKSSIADVSRDRNIKQQDQITLAYQTLLELGLKDKLTAEEESKFTRLMMIVRAADSTRAAEFLSRQLGWENKETQTDDSTELIFKIIKSNNGSSSE